MILISFAACSKAINSDDVSATTDIKENIAEQVFADEKPIEKQALSDCEIIDGLARTPTHYYAARGDSVFRAPLDNIALQTEIPLPGSYENILLTGAEICGITKEWLFINRWEYREENSYGYVYDTKNRTVVTFRIAIESWKAEVISAIVDKTDQLRPLPWYNFASDSLLIPDVNEDIITNDGFIIIEAISMSTLEHLPVVLDGKPRNWSCWWLNTADGRAVFDECEGGTYLFDEQNHTELVSYSNLNCNNPEWQELENGALGGLFCEIINPEKAVWCEYRGEELKCYEICLLDKDGNVVDILLEYVEDSEGNSAYGMSAYDDKLMVTLYSIYGPAEFEFLCDPDTGAMFPIQK